MKILHTADIQLGAQFKTLGDKAGAQRDELKKTFHHVFETGVREGVGLVLICGDLFDSNHPAQDLIEFVRGEITYLKDNSIYLCIVPGHHDFLDEHGIYNRERLDDEFNNVFIFRNPEGEVKEYSDLDFAVMGKPNTASTSTKSPFPDVEHRMSRMKHKILVAHGDLQIPGKSAENYHPISIQELESLADINYVALGHWHSMKDCSAYGNFKEPVWYSGSPELVAFDQKGSGNVLLVEFGENGTKVSPIKVGKRKSMSLEFNLADFAEAGELKNKITALADKDLILEVSIIGLNINNIPISTEKLEEELDEQFFYLRIKDSSHLALQEIPEYSDALIQGHFVKIMHKKIKEAPEAEKKIFEEALQAGLMELMGKEIV